MSAARNSDVTVYVSARTDVGMIRRGNEDCFMVADLSTGNVGLTPEVSRHRLGHQGSIVVVSDGMGGAVAGEIASDLSVNGVREELVRLSHMQDVSERLRRAVEITNRVVYEHAQANPQLSGMGATLTAVLLHGGRAYIAQVGDSRAYLIRSNRIKQLTKDQSLVQLLIDSKAIRPEQANQVPNNVILQALGTRPDVVVAMSAVEICSGDHLLLCSDGLSNKITADEMRDAVLQNPGDLSSACRRLIEMANARGGEDNITAVLARVDGDGILSASERRSITESFRELTSNDLLRIGGAQLDYYHDPASDTPVPPPDVNASLGELGVTLVPVTPGTTAEDGEHPITQVAIPVLTPDQVAPQPYAPQPYAPHAAPPHMAPPPAARPAAFPPARNEAPAPKSGNAGKILLAVGLLMFLFVVAGAALAVAYWWFYLRTAS